MVNYPGTTTHCVYESIPFMIIQNPYKKYVTAGPPKVVSSIGAVFSQKPQLSSDSTVPKPQQ
jgi:hypothetical protein